MINKELIDLCRTLVAAIQESDNFDALYLRRLLLHVVPQLMVEIDILGGMLESLRLPEPEEPEESVPAEVSKKLEKAAGVAIRSRPKSRPARKAKKKGRRR